MYTSSGIVKASAINQKQGWFYLQCDNSIGQYYHWFYNRAGYSWKNGLNGVHITFIAGEKDERQIGFNQIRNYIGQEIEFSYDNKIWTNSRAFWLPVLSHGLDLIRNDMGLTPKFLYHITLGNVK